jgi:hypothetical protein
LCSYEKVQKQFTEILPAISTKKSLQKITKKSAQIFFFVFQENLNEISFVYRK